MRDLSRVLSTGTAGIRFPTPCCISKSSGVQRLFIQSLPVGFTVDRNVMTFDPARGHNRTRAPFTLTGHTSSVTCVAVTPDGTKIVSGGGDDTIRVWDLTSGTALGETLIGHMGSVNSVAVTPDGTKIVSGGDDTIRVWDLATGAPVWEFLIGHMGSVSCVAVTPDGTRIVSGGWDGTIRVWDLGSDAPVGELFTGHTS